MATITLTCETCNKEFEKERNEHNRRVRLGRDKFYCSLSCSGKSLRNIRHIKEHRSDYPIWNHSGNMSDDYSMFRPTLRALKARVKVRPKMNNLTLKHLKEIWDQQGGKCPFTGFDLQLRSYGGNGKKDEPLSPYSASLDRIDNDRGYVIGNVRWVSVMFNFARNKFSDEEVIQFAQAVIRTRG